MESWVASIPWTSWVFALWIATAMLAAPLLLGALLGSRAAVAQRRVTRAVLVASPWLFLAGVLLPDPLGGRPLLRFGEELSPATLQESASQLVRSDREPAPAIEAVKIEAESIGTGRMESEKRWPLAEASTALDRASAPLSAQENAAIEAAFEGTEIRSNAAGGASSGKPAVAPEPAECQDQGDLAHACSSPDRASSPASELVSSLDEAEDALPEEIALLAAPPEMGMPPVPNRTATRSPLPPTELASTPPPITAGDALQPIRHPTALQVTPTRTPVAEQSWPPSRAATESSTGSSFFSAELWGPVLLFLWGIGVLVGWLRIASSLLILHRIRQTSGALGSTRGVPHLDPRSESLPVRIIPGLGSAAAVGIVSPEIWLPAHWSAKLDRSSLHALLGHEVAHHRGRDPLWRIVGAFVGALLWPHPLAHALRRREEHLSELIADRQVIASGAGRRSYAELLADLAADAAGVPNALASGILGTRSPLERRIRMILSVSPARARRTGGWATPTLLGGFCAAMVGLSAWFPIVGNACDPDEKKATCEENQEFVLEAKDGRWIARSPGSEGKSLWSTKLSEGENHAPILIERDGRYARLKIGDRLLLLDTIDGRLLEPPKKRAPVVLAGAKDRSLLRLAALLGDGDDHDHHDHDHHDHDDDHDHHHDHDEDEHRHQHQLHERAVQLAQLESHLRKLEAELAHAEHELEIRKHHQEMELEQQKVQLQADRAPQVQNLQFELMNAERAISLESAKQKPNQDELSQLLAVEADLRAALSSTQAELQRDLAELAEQRIAHRMALENDLHQMRLSKTTQLADVRQALEDARLALELAQIDRHNANQAAERAAREQFNRQSAERRFWEDDQFRERGRNAERSFKRALEAFENHFDPEEFEELFEVLPDALEEVRDVIGGVEDEVEAMEESLEELAEELPEILRGLEHLPELIERTLSERHEGQNEFYRSFERISGELEERLRDERRARKELEAENRALRKEVERLRKQLEKGDLRQEK